MRILIGGFLALHGAAHLFGFLLPWNLLPVNARTDASSTHDVPARPIRVARVLGVLWLALGVGFFLVAVGVFQESSWAMATLIVVTALSLAMCGAEWRLARIGAAIDVVILTIVGVAATIAFRHDMSLAMTRVASGGTLVHTARGPMEYATLGSGDPILVLHGTAGGWDAGIESARHIVPFGYRVIAPSRFGYLGTPLPADPSPAAEADAMAALLDQLRIERVTVMSFSASTAAALQFAIRYPERVAALVLFVPGAGGVKKVDASGPPQWVLNYMVKSDLLMWATTRLAPSLMYRMVGVPTALVRSLPSPDAAEVNNVIDMILPWSLRHKGILNDANTQMGTQPLYPIEKISSPALLITASDDLYGTMPIAEHAKDRMPNARILSFPTGGHLLAGRSREIWPTVASFVGATSLRHSPSARR